MANLFNICSLTAFITTKCSKGFYGDTCSIECVPEMYQSMIGCHDNGTSICLPGKLLFDRLHKEYPICIKPALRLANFTNDVVNTINAFQENFSQLLSLLCLYHIAGFRGQFCEKPDACFYKPCIPSAECINADDKEGGYKCICDGSEGK